MDKERESDLKKKAAAAAAIAAVISSSGAVIDNAIDNPAELLQGNNIEPAVLNIDDEGAVTDESDADKTAPSRSMTLSERILALPMAVRVCVVLPLWAVGHLVNLGIGALAVAATPLVNMLITFATIVLLIGGIFTLAAKIIFPDLPLRKILNRHTIPGIFITSGIVFVGDIVLGFTWADYTTYKTAIIGSALLLALLLLTIRFTQFEKKRRAKKAAKLEAGHSGLLGAKPGELIVKIPGDTFTIHDPLTDKKS